MRIENAHVTLGQLRRLLTPVRKTVYGPQRSTVQGLRTRSFRRLELPASEGPSPLRVVDLAVGCDRVQEVDPQKRQRTLRAGLEHRPATPSDLRRWPDASSIRVRQSRHSFSGWLGRCVAGGAGLGRPHQREVAGSSGTPAVWSTQGPARSSLDLTDKSGGARLVVMRRTERLAPLPL